jgi:two-component system chemotaxis response regulator CheB
LSSLLTGHPDVEVVGTASDGDEALRMAAALRPELITLDLEMPRMDGFTFLRLLMATRPTPVVVISSHSGKENVFRALELGAIDFITKPDQLLVGKTEPMREQLDRMVQVVRQLSPAVLRSRLRSDPVPGEATVAWSEPSVRVPERVVAVAASTGGPTALIELFTRLPQKSSAALVVAQHMPDRFTRTFAERLDRQSPFRVREAEHLHEVAPQNGLVCPGGRCLEVERRNERLVARVVYPRAEDRYAPSADRLFTSVARAAGPAAIAVVMTGMGDDGAKGVQAIKEAGGMVLAESEETAVVFGMPKVAERSGCVDEMLPLPRLVARIVELIS